MYEWQTEKPAVRRLQQLHFPMQHKSLLPGEHTTSQVLCILHHWPCAFCLQWLGQLILQTHLFHKDMCVKRRGYRNIKGSCLACCPVSQQKVSRMGVAMIGCEVIASLHLDAKIGPVACFSQNITNIIMNSKPSDF